MLDQFAAHLRALDADLACGLVGLRPRDLKEFDLSIVASAAYSAGGGII
ncbi:hypothetical protein [Burkholderia metallica]|nr:hypothetical protein [Burkholderia metallica]